VTEPTAAAVTDVRHQVSTYGRLGNPDTGPVEVFVRTEFWTPAEEDAHGAVKLDGRPGTWRLESVIGSIPPDAVAITTAEYVQLIEANRKRAADTFTAAAEAAHGELLAQRAADYDALIAANIPPAVAARLTGHKPTAEETS
jgi:hypothetical protein